MDAQQVPAWLTVVLALGSAAITGAVSAVLAWIQYRGKKAELTSQAELKAREVLFGFYQQRARDYAEEGHLFGKAIGRLCERTISGKRGRHPVSSQRAG